MDLSVKTYRWELPLSEEAKKQNNQQHQLRLFNSFTKKKEVLVTNESKTIKWYSCGPTVYDVSHLGHARCYITFDIIRRILIDYFGYNVFYVMNITDIDDKIIKRARSNYLFDQYSQKALENSKANPSSITETIEQIKKAIDEFEIRKKDELDPDKKEMLLKIIASSRSTLQEIEAKKVILEDALPKLKDVLSDDLDLKLNSNVTDLGIFKVLTNKYEQEFHEDMLKLNVLPPSALTRVSEYIDETGAFIKKLEDNGYAYRSNGSVYFDTLKFDASPKHFYAKLVREAFGHKRSLDEGEGELSTNQDTKKSPSDFALWKKSKQGEPSWKTLNYEAGRPGWHIECSVMASHMLGENFDVHSGGSDLKFPHHDNEIAQAEAYYDSGKGWVNYFVHSGHLTISGCKMSKSLKNFVTIRQALEDYTPRQLRFAFLAHCWADTLDYSPSTMNTATSYEKVFREFFLNFASSCRKMNQQSGDFCFYFKKWLKSDHDLKLLHIKTIEAVDAALCDNLNTRSVLNHLQALIKECNKREQIDFMLYKDIACYINKILSIMGAEFNEINIGRFYSLQESTTSDAGYQSHSALTYVETLALFRSQIRTICKEGNPNGFKQILTLCDNLRDKVLPDLGVRLEDKEVNNQPYIVKLVDRDILAKERAVVEKLEEAKKLKKETERLEKLSLQKQREDKARLPPNEMFLNQTDKYSAFDSTGMPTHDANGKEISKSALKKLQRLYAEQEVRYKKFTASSE